MNGTSHKAVGVAVGAAMVIYAVETQQPEIAFGMITAPMGAMLPDIDHPRSKIGQKRVVTVGLVNKLVACVFLLSLLYAAIVMVTQGFDVLLALGNILYVIPICGVILVANSPKMKEKYPFLHKHRGIMHTLAIPACLFVGTKYVSNVYAYWIIVGLALGYLSHLYADSFTVSGCPLAWPISQKDVSVGPIVTGTWTETVGCAILCTLVVISGYFISRDPGQIMYYFVLIAYAVGSVTPDFFRDLGKRIKPLKKLFGLMHTILFPLGLIIVVYIYKSNYMIVALLGGFTVGVTLHILTEIVKGGKRH